MKHITGRIQIEDNKKRVKTKADDMEPSAFKQVSEIAELFPAVVIEKIKNGKAVVAFTKNDIWVGYSYLRLEENKASTPDSGLSLVTAYKVYRVPVL